MVNYGAWKQIKDIFLIALITLLMAFGVWAAMLITDSDSLKLLVGIYAVAVIYIVSAKIRYFNELNGIISLIKKKK